MASNPYVNKVQKSDGTVIIDLSSDTVEADYLMLGYTAHDGSGAPITGTYDPTVIRKESGASVTLPEGGTFESLSILGSTVNGVSVKTFNLLNLSECVQNYYISAAGKASSDTTSQYTEPIPVVPGETYWVGGICKKEGANKRLHGYSANGTWVSQVHLFGPLANNEEFGSAITIPNNVYYLKLSFSKVDEYVIIAKASSKPTYLPYGIIGLVVTDDESQSALTEIDLDGNVLASYNDTTDILELTSDGSVVLTKNNTDPATIVTLDDIVFPTVDEGYSFSVLANLPASMNLYYSTTGDMELGTKNITSNGTYNASSDGVDGYSSVTVNVAGAALGAKSIASNGTYSASSDSLDGYSSVTVSVPNTYSSGDEGKVVSNGALTSQTSMSIASNGTYDTTTKSQVIVGVSCTHPDGDTVRY